MSRQQPRVRRLRRLIRELEAWKSGERDSIPVLRKPLFEAEQIYERFGLRPGIDVFVPKPGWDQRSLARMRRAWRYEKAKRENTVEGQIQRIWRKNSS
ncbi:MAG: hypothetical protein D6816_16300 [Bacteroidetes bacterium]|nr:MAG: hypothetical protein D6816_16300 [Bacteroidota bacterium]